MDTREPMTRDELITQLQNITMQYNGLVKTNTKTRAELSLLRQRLSALVYPNG